MRGLGQSIVDLASSYRQSGDDTSAQAALQMAASLGQRYGNASAGETLIAQLVGINVERIALTAMDPNSAYGDNGQTVQERINQIVQERTAIQALSKQAGPLWDSMLEQDWLSYQNRAATFGEEAALRWLVNKNGQK
jgi:6-phosphofructokinase